MLLFKLTLNIKTREKRREKSIFIRCTLRNISFAPRFRVSISNISREFEGRKERKKRKENDTIPKRGIAHVVSLRVRPRIRSSKISRKKFGKREERNTPEGNSIVGDLGGVGSGWRSSKCEAT